MEQAELEEVLELAQALSQGGLADAESRCRLQQAAVRRNRVHHAQKWKAQALVEVPAGRHLSMS